ncbi:MULTISPECIES: hypothetical protein [unclassified Streptomyces]|uniref:hypothetical protein n=1 Tax=unclassified Streptomyces TaxID=2593676 RepID=UPI001396A5E8|nr:MULTISPECIES: hypothetical protein [unclassified Streptomyces]
MISAERCSFHGLLRQAQCGVTVHRRAPWVRGERRAANRPYKQKSIVDESSARATVTETVAAE